MPANKGPIDAVVALSYRCNLRCSTCELGARGDDESLTPDVLRKLPPTLRFVNLSGGEPFLLANLAACARAVATAAEAEITISTNGTLPARAEEVVREVQGDIPDVRVAVSLDGLESTHDRIRRAPGSFQKALVTIEKLSPLLGRKLHIAFTISAANVRDFRGVAALAEELGLPLSLAATHTSEHYFRPGADAVPAPADVAAAAEDAAAFYLREVSRRAAARAYFAAALAQLAMTGRRPLPCRAGDRFFYLDPGGDVFLCNMRAERMGNLREQGFEDIWAGERRRQLLATAGDACPTPCWMVCTARTAIMDHPARVGWWAARAYARRLVGLGAPTP